MHTRLRRAPAALLAVPLLITLVACGDDDSDVEATRPEGFEATPAYLARALEESSSAPFRFEAFMTMGQRVDGDFQGVEDVLIGSGEMSGTRSRMVMDPGQMVIELAAAEGVEPGVDPDEVDLTMETVTDGDVFYVHAPGYAEMVERLPADRRSAHAELVAGLGDSWGRVDLTGLADDAEPSELFSQLNQGQNLDPRFYIELVKDADDVKDLGSDTVDGVGLVGLAADVPLAAMIEAQGIDPSTLVGERSGENLAEAMEEFMIPVGVWIDEDGNVRRLSMDIGKGLAAAAEATGESMGSMEGYTLGMSLRFFDHGDDAIEIDVPDEADTVDLTEKVRDL